MAGRLEDHAFVLGSLLRASLMIWGVDLRVSPIRPSWFRVKGVGISVLAGLVTNPPKADLDQDFWVLGLGF